MTGITPIDGISTYGLRILSEPLKLPSEAWLSLPQSLVCVRLHRVHDLARDKMYNPHTSLKARVTIIWPVLDSPKDLMVVGNHSAWLQGLDVSLSAKRRTNSPINDLVVARRPYNHQKVVRIKSCIDRNPVAMPLKGQNM